MIKSVIFTFLTAVAFSVFGQQAPASENFSNPTIQIGVVVSDLYKAVEFYTDVIGMIPTGSFEVAGDKAKNMGLTDGRSIDVTVLKLEESPQANEWKLMSFGKKAPHSQERYIHDDIGMQYITIFVTNIQPFIDRAQKYNVPILSGTPSLLENGRKFLLIQDPDGTFIELISNQ